MFSFWYEQESYTSNKNRIQNKYNSRNSWSNWLYKIFLFKYYSTLTNVQLFEGSEELRKRFKTITRKESRQNNDHSPIYEESFDLNVNCVSEREVLKIRSSPIHVVQQYMKMNFLNLKLKQENELSYKMNVEFQSLQLWKK